MYIGGISTHMYMYTQMRDLHPPRHIGISPHVHVNTDTIMDTGTQGNTYIGNIDTGTFLLELQSATWTHGYIIRYMDAWVHNPLHGRMGT